MASRAAVLTVSYASVARSPPWEASRYAASSGSPRPTGFATSRTAPLPAATRTPAARSSRTGATPRCSTPPQPPWGSETTATPAAANWSAARPAASMRQPGQPGTGPDRDAGPQPAHHHREAREPGRVAAVRMEVDAAAVLGGDRQHRLHVSGRVGVRIGAAAHHPGAHLHRVPQHREPPAPHDPGQQTRHGDDRQIAEPAQRTPCLEHRLHGSQPLRGTDPYVGTQRGGAVSDLEQRRLGRAALDVVGVVRDGPVRRDGAQRGVTVRVRLGGGGQEQMPVQVHARSRPR